MVDSCVFLFVGSDELQKQKKIESLQAKIFPPGLKDLNYTLFNADEKQLSLKDLQEALSCWPTQGARKRMILIRRAHKLKQPYAAYLLKELRELGHRALVILDVPQAQEAQEFVETFIKGGAQVVRFKEESAANVFDLGRAIVGHQPQTALKLVSGFLASRQRPEKILGAIFWQWERSHTQRRLSPEAYQRGLKLLAEADRRLKSSSSAFARQTLILEALVVKLSYLS